MNRAKYDALDVANYIVNYSIDSGNPVSNLKLQKLLYYVQAASLVENDCAMFREDISAWKYGPVIEVVYHAFKWYVDKLINDKVTEKDTFFDFDIIEHYDPDKMIDDEDKTLIQKIVASYKKYSPLDMVKKTHGEAPWKNAYDGNEEYIRLDVIRRFYGGDNKRLIYGN